MEVSRDWDRGRVVGVDIRYPRCRPQARAPTRAAANQSAPCWHEPLPLPPPPPPPPILQILAEKQNALWVSLSIQQATSFRNELCNVIIPCHPSILFILFYIKVIKTDTSDKRKKKIDQGNSLFIYSTYHVLPTWAG